MKAKKRNSSRREGIDIRSLSGDSSLECGSRSVARVLGLRNYGAGSVNRLAAVGFVVNQEKRAV